MDESDDDRRCENPVEPGWKLRAGHLFISSRGVVGMSAYRYHNLTRNRSTPCVCPRCGIRHEKAMSWSGKEPARKFCLACEQIAQQDYTSEIYSLGCADEDESMFRAAELIGKRFRR